VNAVIRELPKVGRVMRKPQHSFSIRQMPFVIQPFFIAPVLPGETMKNLLMQARAVTDPIKNPIMGWWHEYYFFYVKHRDMALTAEFQKMMLDPTWDWNTAPGVKTVAASLPNYFAGNGIDWTQQCLTAVVNEFFRNEDENISTFTVGGLPIASFNLENWMDSLIPRSQLAPAEDLIVNPAASDLLASEIDRTMRQYELLKMNGLVQQSYEDYLATYGVTIQAAQDPNKPELLRFIRDWTYPTNTIDPTNGTPRSACSWSIAERADKDRFFREPGFIFGVTVTRPKVQYKNQRGSAVWYLRNVMTWLPSVMQDDPYTSLQEVDFSTVSPLTGIAANYVVDVRDLFIYGDQFVNYDLTTATDANLVAMPASTTAHRYASQADIDGLFVTPASAKMVKIDGVVNLSILGRQRDTTPTERGMT